MTQIKAETNGKNSLKKSLLIDYLIGIKIEGRQWRKARYWNQVLEEID